MAELVKVGPLSTIPEGSMKTIVIQGKRIAIARIANEFFAFDDTCSHEECSLGTEGFIEDHHVVCGCHGAQFDIQTGDVLSLPATTSIQTYTITIELNDIYIFI